MDKPIQSFQIAKNIKVIAWLYSEREQLKKSQMDVRVLTLSLGEWSHNKEHRYIVTNWKRKGTQLYPRTSEGSTALPVL